VHYAPGGTPARQDGSAWPFLLINSEGAAIGAETVSELVDEVLPDHSNSDDADRFGLRLELLAELVNQCQAMDLAARRAQDASLDELLGEAGLTALIAPKTGVSLDMPHWPFDVPLFLMATQYEPYTDLPAPTGTTVVLVDPGNERAFLDGLVMLGAVELYVSGD
jgi:hypothetical protein